MSGSLNPTLAQHKYLFSNLFSGCYKFILISYYGMCFNSLIKLIFTHFYRTVLTHVEKSLYCYLFFHLCTAYPLFLTRRYAGPFPEVLCWWMKLIVNFVPNCLFFSFCVNIILRVSIKAKFKLEIQNSNPN